MLTAYTRRSAKDYIDDVAMDASDAEGEYQHPPHPPPPVNKPEESTDTDDIQMDEEEMDDPDSAEGQARAHDNGAYDMRAILEGHEARIRAPGRYRVPKALLARRAPTPSRAPTPPTASTSQTIPTRDPRVRNTTYREPAPASVPSQPAQPPFNLWQHLFIGTDMQPEKRARSPAGEESEPEPKRRHLEETPQLRNHFLVDPWDKPEPCTPDPNDFAPNRE